MQSFALYASMSNSMQRLMNATYTEKHHFKEENESKSKDEKIILNLTHPDNLRSYFYTHEAMTKREDTLEVKKKKFFFLK